jgi:MFS family permease
LLARNGDANAGTIGLILACGTGAVLAGTLAARQLVRLRTTIVLVGALLGVAGGLLIMASNSRTSMIAFGVVVQQFAGGVMLPTAIGYALSGLTREQQGRAAGLWWSVYSIAQFLTPVVVNLAQVLTGSLARGIAGLALGGMLFTLPVAYLYRDKSLQPD